MLLDLFSENDLNRHKYNMKIWFQKKGLHYYQENIIENEMKKVKSPLVMRFKERRVRVYRL